MKKSLGDAPLTIGGWLWFVGIRLLLGIIVNGKSNLNILLLNLDIVGQIIRILSILAFMYSLVVLTLFCKKNRAFPVAYIVLESCSIIINLASFLMLAGLGPIRWDAYLILQAVIPTLIGVLMIVYIRLSKRVKKTFIYKWNDVLDRSLVATVNGHSAIDCIDK